MKIRKTAGMLIAGTLLGMTAYSATSQPIQVQAKASYRVQITKNAYVYTSKGKKTKTIYNKHKVLTAYRVRKIHGKYYYDLGHGKYVRTSYAKKYYYRTYKQSKKITRTIKLYQPKGKKYVYQNAYVKRTVKQNTRTGRKTYGKWGISSWGAYTAPAVKGYTASPEWVASETVYSWTKNKTVKVKYKKSSKKATSKSTPAKQNSSSTKSQSNKSSNVSKSNSSSKSSSTKNEFTVHLINKETKNGKTYYTYNLYRYDDRYGKEDPDIISNEYMPDSTDNGDNKHLVSTSKLTVSKVGYDHNGNAFYYVDNLPDGEWGWIPASDTDKQDKSHYNTLTVTSTQSFNVQAKDVNKNYDFYVLQSNGTLKWGGNVPARLWYYESQQYYPWIYTVVKTAKDKNGVVYYCLREDESYFKETWVKASEFEATNKANNVDSNVRFQWTAKENSDLGQRELAIINKLRSEVGSQDLYLDSSHQDEVNQRAQNRVQYYIQNGTVNHDGAFADAAENILAYKIEGVQPTTQAVQDGNIRLLTNYWRAEKAMYEKGGYSYEDYGHYYNLINPAYHSVTVGSAVVTVNGKRYVVVVEEYWK